MKLRRKNGREIDARKRAAKRTESLAAQEFVAEDDFIAEAGEYYSESDCDNQTADVEETVYEQEESQSGEPERSMPLFKDWSEVDARIQQLRYNWFVAQEQKRFFTDVVLFDSYILRELINERHTYLYETMKVTERYMTAKIEQADSLCDRARNSVYAAPMLTFYEEHGIENPEQYVSCHDLRLLTHSEEQVCRLTNTPEFDALSIRQQKEVLEMACHINKNLTRRGYDPLPVDLKGMLKLAGIASESSMKMKEPRSSESMRIMDISTWIHSPNKAADLITGIRAFWKELTAPYARSIRMADASYYWTLQRSTQFLSVSDEDDMVMDPEMLLNELKWFEKNIHYVKYRLTHRKEDLEQRLEEMRRAHKNPEKHTQLIAAYDQEISELSERVKKYTQLSASVVLNDPSAEITALNETYQDLKEKARLQKILQAQERLRNGNLPPVPLTDLDDDLLSPTSRI